MTTTRAFTIFMLLSASSALAAERTAEHATLWLDSGGDGPRRALLMDTEVDIEVLGMVAFAEVRQRYVNDSGTWAEARFVFPLPGQAAVDRLTIRIGERLILGEVQEREQARRTYEQARQQGQRAGLVEQERANLFTTSVANIGPGEEIEIGIGFQLPVRYEDGRFSLHFPTTFVPRFIPGRPLLRAEDAPKAGSGWATDTDAVPDASRITPPVQHPAAGSANPLRMQVTLRPGMALATIESQHHRVRRQQRGDVWHIELADGLVASDRDFELSWTPQDVGQAQSAVYRERIGSVDYVMLMLVPPHQFRADHTPREVTLIVDTSGSMRGAAIEQARAALQVALAALAPQDRFNVIEFNSVTRSLFDVPVRADAGALAQADRFVSALHANGGTVMLPALEKAMRAPPSPGFLRQIVFITDGSVGNEDQVLAQITRDIRDGRLFTVGIGHGVNGHFLRKAADFGRGSQTLIARQDQVEERMIELLTRLTSPVLHDIEMSWPAHAEAFPQQVPDLYTGEPLVVLARMPVSAGNAKASGLSDGNRWQRTLALEKSIDVPGVASLWARRRIESLQDARGNGSDAEWIRGEVTATALQYQLLSPYTSMVAVEHMPARPAFEALHAHDMPQNLPHGRQLEGIVGGGRAMPGTATGAAAHMLQGLMLLLLAILLLAGRRVLHR